MMVSICLKDGSYETGKQHSPRYSLRSQSGSGCLRLVLFFLFWLASQLINLYSPVKIDRSSQASLQGAL